eukprot:TRINITY_DN1859_c0_g1_i1.p1 TRINITY_DN1859_c0_g1~~TRINITY_DN1859_c0_g1_i1.p1  ORF type:complete len:428 (-),score=109.38 TRINITY_DN1859_c0_g1_i1:44-1300(-)
MSTPTVHFFFDIVCPFAYLASTQIEALAQRAGATVRWVPTLLGGIYKETSAPQGKDGSASDVMPLVKVQHEARDLQLFAQRYGVPLRFPASHPIRSVKALRLLLCAPAAAVPALARALYKAYWVENADISDPAVLGRLAAAFSVDLARIESAEVKAQLKQNVTTAVALGAPGVPTFWIEGSDRIFFGQDNLHFLEGALRNTRVPPTRLSVRPPTRTPRSKLLFFHDFASPWSYVGSTQVEKLAVSCNAELVYVPILLGALFREIGTANVPMLTFSEAKRAYMSRALSDWTAFHGVDLAWPRAFPLRTVLPLRVALANPQTTNAIYAAAWQKNINIGDASLLSAVLTEAGFDGSALLAAAEKEDIKAALKRNNELAVSVGVPGVPSYKVDAHPVIWGQDRSHIVGDLLCGWSPQLGAKL